MRNNAPIWLVVKDPQVRQKKSSKNIILLFERGLSKRIVKVTSNAKVSFRFTLQYVYVIGRYEITDIGLAAEKGMNLCSDKS